MALGDAAGLVRDWDVLTHQYFAWLERRRKSPETIRTYAWPLKHFRGFLAGSGLADLADLEPADIEEWQDQLANGGGMHGDGRAPRSQQMARQCVRECLRFAARRDVRISPEVLDAFEPVKVPRLLPRPLTTAQVDLINACLTPRRPKASLQHLRTRALWFYMVTTGARISEVLSLDRSDLVTDSPIVIQKGGGERTLWAAPIAVQALYDYLRRREDLEPAVFVTHGNPPTRRLQVPGAREAWQQLADHLGLPRFKLHQIRHTCATELLDAGVPIEVVAKRLGHANMHTIHVYADVRSARQKEASDALEARFGALKPDGQKFVALRDGRGRRIELA